MFNRRPERVTGFVIGVRREAILLGALAGPPFREGQPQEYEAMKCVILGCGRVGSMLATQLSEEGHTVAIIDKSREAFRRLGSRYTGQSIYGQGIDEDTLRRAGIESADVFVALTQGDNTNIMASQVVRERFKVPQVLCRVYDPIRAQVFRELGIQTVPTAKLLSGLFRDMIAGDSYRSVSEYLGQSVPNPVEVGVVGEDGSGEVA